MGRQGHQMSDVCCLKEKSWRLGRRVQVIKGLGGWLGLDSNSRCSVASALWQGPLPKFGCTPAHKRTLDSAKPKTEHTSGTYRDGREGVHEFMWGSFEQAARHRTDGDESTDPRSNLASYIRASGRHHVGFPFWLIAVSEHPSASRAAELSDGSPSPSKSAPPTLAQPIHPPPPTKAISTPYGSNIPKPTMAARGNSLRDKQIRMRLPTATRLQSLLPAKLTRIDRQSRSRRSST